MEKDFVPYAESLALNELDFEEPCIAWYNNGEFSILGQERLDKFHTTFPVPNLIHAPFFYQAFRWFWKKHGKFVDFFVDDDKTFGFMISFFVPEGLADMPAQYQFGSPEEAQLAALRKLIETVKNKE